MVNPPERTLNAMMSACTFDPKLLTLGGSLSSKLSPLCAFYMCVGGNVEAKLKCTQQGRPETEANFGGVI